MIYIQKRALSITAEVQSGSWAEGMGVRSLVFAGNRVEKCDKLDDYLGMAWAGTLQPDGVISSYPLLRGIRILNNTFAAMPRRSVVIESSADAVISGNLILNDAPDEPQAAERGQILVDKSANVSVEGNAWRTAAYTAQTLVSVDRSSTSGVSVESGNVMG